MATPQKYSHDTDKTVDALGGRDRYIVVYVDDDNELRPMVERKSNGQHLHMTFKTLTVARNAAYGVSAAEDGYPEDQIAVYDKQYSTVI